MEALGFEPAAPAPDLGVQATTSPEHSVMPHDPSSGGVETQLGQPMSMPETAWLGRLSIIPTAFEDLPPPEAQTQREEIPIYSPQPEGIGKEFTNFMGVMFEVIADVALPVELPRSALTSDPHTESTA